MSEAQYTAFNQGKVVGQGNRQQLVQTLANNTPENVLIFNDHNGEQVEFGLLIQQTIAAEHTKTARGPGRPRLGVVAREVTLLPRHWEWLNSQPGGASVALRKLVERASKEHANNDKQRIAQEATFRFINAIAGNEMGFEEACRALYAKDQVNFEQHISQWPTDIAVYSRQLAQNVFIEE